MNLLGKVALVTGGARRVGRATAVRLAEAGCDVAVTYRGSEAEAAEVVEAIERTGRRGWAIRADFAEAADPEPVAARIAEELLSRAGRADVLVHNASVFRPSAWGSLRAGEWAEQMTINALAPVLLTQALTGPLRAGEGGRVIHLLDIHVMGRPRPGHAAYNASKAALLEMTRSLAVELAPRVTVNGVAPGVVAWAQNMTDQEKAAYLKRVPLGRPGTPDDAARAVVFLARDADYLTGEVIRVDGGRWLT